MRRRYPFPFLRILLPFVIFGWIIACSEDDPAPNEPPTIDNPLDILTLDEGFGTAEVSIANVFSDPNGDQLTFSAISSDRQVATVSLTGTTLSISEVGTGTTNVRVTAEDPMGASASSEFSVTVNPDQSEPLEITFGASTGSSITIDSWTEVSGASGYVLVVNTEDSFSDLADGEDPPASTTYIGTSQQVVYSGATVSAITVHLLQDQSTYHFKVYSSFSNNNVYDNSFPSAEATTGACQTSSTTSSQVCFEVDAAAQTRTISANQFPSHEVGNFPNADPTAIEVTRVLDLTPELASEVTFVYNETGPPTPSNKNFWQFGIATNGVEFHPMGLKPWENPNNGEENWEWQQQVTEEGQTDLDAWGAHVTSQGNYHYHGDIVGLATDEDGSRHSLIYGFAGDGFPIYYKYGYTNPNDPSSLIKELTSSYQLRSGSRPGDGTTAPDGAYDGTYIQDFEYVADLGDLDECNGRTGVTPEFPEGTYYYVITADFPVTPNCFKGTPDEDWLIGR